MQSTAARVTVAIVAIVVVAILFIVLSGGDEESGDTTTQAEVSTTTTGTEPLPEEEPKPEKPDKPAEPEVPTIEVVGGEAKGGPVDLEFTKGDQVRFDVTSDVDEEIHVHGYDVYADLVAGKTQEVSFPADIDGIFEVELHGTGAVIAELTVQP